MFLVQQAAAGEGGGGFGAAVLAEAGGLRMDGQQCPTSVALWSSGPGVARGKHLTERRRHENGFVQAHNWASLP